MKAPRYWPLLWASLLGVPLAGSAFQVTLFPASDVYDPDTSELDARLGFTTGHLIVERFESEALVPEIKSNITGHSGGANDIDELALTWDGKWPSSISDNETTFWIQIPGVRAFGIGIGDNDFGGNEELAINGGKIIPLNDLPGHVSNGQGRAFYLKIEAQAGDPDIRSVRIAKGYTLRFDHLVLRTASPAALTPPPQPPPPTLWERPPHLEREPLEAARPDANLGVPPPAPTRPSRRAPAPAPRSRKAVALLSEAGRRYVGDQLRWFFVDPDGVITTSKAAWICLHNTEGKPFRLQGRVWLAGPFQEMLFPGDLPDGFALFVREWDGLQRYSLTSRGADVKRRLYRGEKLTDIVNITRFDEPTLGKWTPFNLDANWDRILFSFADQSVTMEGPLDMDGANKIAIAPGTRLRDLRIEVFETP